MLQKRAANYDKHTRSSASIRSVTGESLLTCNGEAGNASAAWINPHSTTGRSRLRGTDDDRHRGDDPVMAGAEPMLDISSEMARLTYSIVGQTLFSFNTGEDAAAVEKAMRVILPHVFGRLGNLVNGRTGFPLRPTAGSAARSPRWTRSFTGSSPDTAGRRRPAIRTSTCYPC